MRSGYPAAVLCFALAPLGAQLACAQSAQNAAPAAAPPAAQAATPATTGSDAADRHAKRTACIKDAKAKKLHGPDRTAYIKSCASSA
jgi:hypothetical protein